MKIFLLFVMGLLSVTPSAAQNELQIMVSGPWSYVADSNHPDRIFLVAPPSAHHAVYILTGPNAANFGGSGIQPGTYTLDFNPSFQGVYNAVPQDAPVVCQASVNPAKVSTILANQSGTNYVISLPKPDDYSTHIDLSGVIDGYSESKVSASDSSVKPSVQPQIYTTWMVLHYGVKKLPPYLTRKETGTQFLTTDSAGKTGGISIVLGDPNPLDEDPQCDSVSLESFHERNGLWGLTEYARFPKSALGHQIHYLYDYKNCKSVSIMNAEKRVKDTDMTLFSGGGADCHACQTSINKAGPPPPTP